MQEENEEEIVDLPWERMYEYTWNEEESDSDKEVEKGSSTYYDMLRKDRQNRIDYSAERCIFRNLVIVLDLSYTMADADFKPSRLEVIVSQLKIFVRNFLSHNPLSTLGIVVSHDKRAFQLTPLSKHVSEHLRALDNLQSSGGFSFQSSLEMAINAMSLSLSHYSKEIVCIISSLNTFDPGDIYSTFKKIQDERITCSVLSLSGEVFVFQKVCNLTGGQFCVPEASVQIQYFLNQQIQPPLVKDEQMSVKQKNVPYTNNRNGIIPVGFPSLKEEKLLRICSCHLRFCNRYYQCPRCHSYVCELPIKCPVCNLLLLDYTNLTQSYHYLFPTNNFKEIQNDGRDDIKCYGCFETIGPHDIYTQCNKCHKYFCQTCDAFIHDNIYHCPGCLYNE